MRDLTDVSGFSLVESLIACALLATALLSIGHLSTAAIALRAEAHRRTSATLLAISKLEELRSSVAPVAGGDTVDSRGQPPQPGVSRLFDRRWSIAVVSPDALILTVVVTPFPRGVDGREVRLTGGWTPVQ